MEAFDLVGPRRRQIEIVFDRRESEEVLAVEIGMVYKTVVVGERYYGISLFHIHGFELLGGLAPVRAGAVAV